MPNHAELRSRCCDIEVQAVPGAVMLNGTPVSQEDLQRLRDLLTAAGLIAGPGKLEAAKGGR